MIHFQLYRRMSFQTCMFQSQPPTTKVYGLRIWSVKEILKTTVNHVMRGLLSRSITGVHFLKVQQQSR